MTPQIHFNMTSCCSNFCMCNALLYHFKYWCVNYFWRCCETSKLWWSLSLTPITLLSAPVQCAPEWPLYRERAKLCEFLCKCWMKTFIFSPNEKVSHNAPGYLHHTLEILVNYSIKKTNFRGNANGVIYSIKSNLEMPHWIKGNYDAYLNKNIPRLSILKKKALKISLMEDGFIWPEIFV